MVVECKWGEKKWSPRNDVPRFGGIILHATDPPGAVHGWSKAGITCVIGETGAGALLLADGMPKPISSCAETERLVRRRRLAPCTRQVGTSVGWVERRRAA
jgi:hypothetical protein